MTRDFLTGSAEARDYLAAVEARSHHYNGFSLIVGGLDGLSFFSNRGGTIQTIAPGVHGLSNHLLNEPWPKVRRGIEGVNALLAAAAPQLSARLFAPLADCTPAPDALLPATGIALERERIVSAAFIASEAYGTRASTVVLVSAAGEVMFCERSYGPRGAPAGVSEQRFRLERGPYSSS